MSYQVLALKWRPPQFGDVVGQEAVTRTLENAIKSDRIAHAFLFTGVRGVGKTTTARILAKALNCHEGLTPSPCDQCPSCTEIAQSNSVDVQEIDAASNTSVDDVREIRESVQYGTARDRYKIFIIDEVHMLSRPAFNALLKTLEEPPAHVKFILATTELHKIPVTITSRCQQYEFKPIPFAQILNRLEHICREEEIQISDYGLRSVATVARGSMRDAQSALDRILALSGQKVDDDEIRALLGVIDEAVLARIVDGVAERDRESLLIQVKELVESGVDPANLCRKFIQHLRNLMVCKVAGWNPDLLHLPDSEKETLLAQIEHFSTLDLIRFYDVLEKVAQELREQADPFIHIEMALMKLIELASLADIEEVISRGGAGGADPLPNSPATQMATSNRSLKSAAPTPARQQAEPLTQQGNGKPPMATGDTVKQLLRRVQDERVPLATFLQQASAVEFDQQRLLIRFSPGKDFARQMVEQPDNIEFLTELCAKISGSACQVQLALETETSEAAEKKNDPLADERVRQFLSVFPGKYTVNREDD